MKDQYCGSPAAAHEPVAIVGMSCNLPGANHTPAAFFDFLLKKKSGVIEIPQDRWDVDVFYDANPGAIAKSVSKWGGFIEGLRNFDAKFFGISPREAASMDPQQRMILQGAVEAMMDAQIPLDEFSRQSTGVFVGISQAEYRTLQEMRNTSNEAFAGTGYALCIAANRVSHRLNLHGPSYAIDTACSSSLTALHQAIQNIRNGACDMAVVSGVNALTHPASFFAFSKAGMLSPTGQISTFDRAANGFVRAEGMGTVVIKPLSRAQADGDRIHAVIEGTAANQDGATTTITAPSQHAQISMLHNLFASVDVRPDQIGFVEAHGTGTPIGDPIEAGAIGTVIGQHSPDRPVFVGSTKANIGHLESGAGITGLIKAAMAVKTGVVPPNVNFKNPNPYIPFDALNLEVPVKPEPFPEADGKRYAVVNSFGFGGSNASALVSAPPPMTYDHHPVSAAAPVERLEIGEDGFPHMIPVSGATPEALQANAAALLKAMSGKGGLAQTLLSDIAAALATKRSHLMHRAVILARTDKQFKAALRKLAKGAEDTAIVIGQKQAPTKLCFTFSGQGSQWWGMARDLLTRNATFASAVDAFDAEFIPVAGWSIRAELMRDKASSRIDDTTITQPALFAIQSGLAALWKQLGVEPDMVAGHSIGEAAASYVVGGLSLSGAAKFLSKRGVIRDQLGAKGAMAAIGMNATDVEAILPAHGKLGIAAVNGPGSTTISGDYDALHEFVEDFTLMRPDTFIRVLTVDTAWHSYHLDAGEAWFRREMATIDWSVPHKPFISTVTGRPETRFDTDYGWLNLRKPVRFQAGVETAIGLGARSFVELGPAATLAGPTKSTALESGATVTVLGSINRKDNDFDALARAAATLFVQGQPLKWKAITGTPDSHVELPQNVWITDEYWLDSEECRELFFTPRHHAFLGAAETGKGTSWHNEFNLRTFPYLKDHRMQAEALFPAAGYLDTMIALCRQQFGADKVIELEDTIIHEALFIAEDQDILLNNVFDPVRNRITFFSRVRDTEDDWTLRSECRVRATDVPPPHGRTLDETSDAFKPVDLDYVYDKTLSTGFINYGEAFQTIDALWMSKNKTVARLTLQPGGEASKDRHHLHPTLMDGCLQLLDPTMTLACFEANQRAGEFVTMPVGCDRIRVYGDFPDEVIVEADQFRHPKDDASNVGFVVYDLDGNVLVTVEGLRVAFLPTKKFEAASDDTPARFVRQDIVEVRAEAAPEVTDARWVVLTSEATDGGDLCTAITGLGAQVQRIERSTLGDDPGGALADMLGDDIEAGAIGGILVTWPLNVPQMSATSSTEEIFEAVESCTKDLISLGELMDYARGGTVLLPKFIFLTSGAYQTPTGRAVDVEILTQMPLATLVRGLATETPEYSVRVIDADRDTLRSPDLLARQILTQSHESELILKGGKCFAPRLTYTEVEDYAPKLLKVTEADTTTNFHATMRTPGIIDHVELAEIPLPPIAANEVRVRVAAVGLNFRDIMAVTGLLPLEAEPEPAWENLGLEFGGVVEAVGADVNTFQPGDRVMGLGKRCLQRFFTADHRALTLVPDHISLAEASTIPSAFATAHYALNRAGRMEKGDKVLIHVATGGVGTAAVQLAQSAGAEIFATAGSPQKRQILRDLGIEHVMDSRSLKFADDVMRITDGAGVDILLNSLPGEYITKGLDIMAPYGRFLEIGKRDVYEDASVGMKALRRNVSLSVLDLAAMGLERPDLMAGLFADLAVMLENKEVSPLPLTEFPISQVGEAIRYMSQAKHVGKVVVTLEEEEFDVRRDEGRPATLSANASYLITGGTGGFSLSIADWLSDAGAGQLVLASRSGKVAPEDQEKIAQMEARGTQVSIVALDVTDSAAVDRFAADAQQGAMPIKGVVHGAAVIKDGLANQLTDDMITDVLSPKVRGAWNLHRAFAQSDQALDFMIGFSSIAQVVGSAGQCNYIAGNAFLDALAQYRTGLGLPGTAIDWGVIADAGFVSGNSALASYLESVGQFGLTQSDASNAMELAITRDAPTFLYARADWGQVARANPALGGSPRLAGLLSDDNGGTTQVRARLMALEGDTLVLEAEDFIKDEVTNVLKIDKTSINAERPMSELGLDSLSSFELKVRIETALDIVIPVSKFLQAPSISELAKMLGAEVETLRRTEAAALLSNAAETAGGTGATLRTGMPATSRQLGMLRDALSPLTSDTARRALEHHSEVALPAAVTLSALHKALRKAERRHPLLKMRIDVGEGVIHTDGAGITLHEGPNAAGLDVGGGEFVRVTYQPDAATPLLGIQIHASLGDAASARLLAREIKHFLTGKAAAKAMSRKSLIAALGNAHFDPENPASQQDRAFHQYALSFAKPKPVPFVNRSRALLPPMAGRNHGPAGVLTAMLPTRDRAAMLCTLAGALRHATQSKGATLIGYKRSLRAGITDAAIGPFEAEYPLVVPETGASAATMAQFDRVLVATETHLTFDSFAAETEFAQQFTDWRVSPFQVLFESVPELTDAVPTMLLHDVWVQAAQQGEQTHLRLIFDRDVVEPDVAQAIIERLAQSVTAELAH